MFFKYGLLLNVAKSCCLLWHAQLCNWRPITLSPGELCTVGGSRGKDNCKVLICLLQMFVDF